MADRSVKVVISAQVGGLVNGMRTASRAVDDFGQRSGKWFDSNRQSLDELASGAAKTGLALTAMAGFAVKSAMDWEQAWTGVVKTVSGTPAQLAKLEDGLRSLAVETGFAHEEVAGVAEAAGQLGVKTENIEAFTKTMLDLGVSTNLTAEEAATSIAQMANVMGTSAGDIDNLASSLVALGNDGASTESQIIQMAQRISGAAATVGMSEADVLSIANAVASLGIEVEAGGTAISTVLATMARESANGGPKLEAFARTAQMSGEQFAAAFRDDPTEAFESFIAGLAQVQDAGGNVYGILKQIGLSDVRVSQALLGMASANDVLVKSLQTGEDAWEQNTALAAEAEKFYDTTSQKGKQAWASIKDSAIDAGDAMLPVVAEAFDGVSGIAEAYRGLPGVVKGGLTAIAGTGGVTLLAMAGMIKLAGAVRDAKVAYDLLSASSARASGAILAAGRAGGGLAILAGVQAVGDSATKRNAKELDNLGDSLLKFAEKGKASGELADIFGKDFGGVTRTLGKDIDSLGEALSSHENMADDNFLTRLWRRTGGQGGSTGTTGWIYEQQNAIKDMDAALAEMSRDRPDDAIKAFEGIRDAALDTGASVDDVARRFPIMTSLMRTSSEAMGGSSDAAELLNGNLSELAPAAQATAQQMKELEDQASQIGDSFLDAGDALKGSLGDWKKTLSEQTDALRDFRKNAATALRKGADEDLVEYLVSKGPEGAAMLKQLADDAKSMNGAWRDSREEAAKFIAFKADTDWTVITEFKTAGADDAIETAVEVADAANLNDQQVRTILEALDYASPDIKAVLAKLHDLDQQKADPEITATDHASGVIAGVQAGLYRLSGGVQVPVSIKVAGAVPNLNDIYKRKADGGFYAGDWRAFADGGVDEYGRSVPRESQMRSGSRGVVMWGEAETGWEAYVSGKPGKRDKNRAVAAEAVGRLGGSVQWFADGGFTEAVSARELTSMRIRVRDLKRSLRETEKTKHGRRHTLRGLDRLEARQELREAEAELAEQKKIRRQVGRGKKYRTAGAYNRAMQAREDAATAAEDRRGVASSFTDGLDGDAFKSPASLERALATMLRDSAEFTTLLASLRKAGASPWLLEQVMKAGPSRATNRTIRALLGDTARLKRLNAMSAGIVTTGNQYAALTSGKGFTPAWSGSSGFSQAALNKAMSQVSLAPSSVAALGDYLLTAAATTSGRQLDYRAREAAMSVALGGAWTGGVS